MHQMQKARAQVLKSSTLKFQQSNKCLWGNKRGRTKRRTTQELQELDPLCSPHLEEILIGGNVDLGLLLQSSKDQRVWVEGLGDIKEMSLQQWRREKSNLRGQACWLEEDGGVFIPLPGKLAVAASYAPEFPAQVTGNSGLHRKLRPPRTGYSVPHQGLNRGSKRGKNTF